MHSWEYIRDFFKWRVLWKSFLEILALIIVAALPLIINLVFSTIHHKGDLDLALKEKVIPGELLSYILSFMAPAFFLIYKTHKKNYPLPLLGFVGLTSLVLYIVTIVLYLAAKNKWDSQINLEHHDLDAFYFVSLVMLVITLLVRMYVVYHTTMYTNYFNERNKSQEDFNNAFKKNINE